MRATAMRSTGIDWAAHIEAVARRLRGEPNQHLSSKTELRFGSNGGLRVTVAGEHRGTWTDFTDGNASGGVLDLIAHDLHCTKSAAFDWLKTELKVDMPDDKPAPKVAKQAARPAAPQRVVDIYRYNDEQGSVLYRVLRWGPHKTFTQNPPDGKGGWITGPGCMNGVRRVPYHINEWLWHPDRTLYIAEGEKDADRLRALGLLATCNAGGAGNWLPTDKDNAAEFIALFSDRTIVVLPDNDEDGRKYADAVVRSLLPVAAEIRVVALPGLAEKGDVSDWLDAGGDKDALLALADAAVPVREAPTTPANVVRLRAVESEPKPEGDALELFGHPLNDIGNAERLIARYGDKLRYVVNVGWFVWDGRRFHYDPAIVKARIFAHDTVRDMLVNAFDAPSHKKEQEERKKGLIKFAISSGNTGKINGMLAQAEPQQAIENGDLDRDPWLFNCANGTLDLRSGELRPHSQDDLLSKLSPVAFDPNAECPIWEKTILEIFGGDREMVDYVQRAIGYSATGLTTEQVIFIMHGAGSNGKSLMLTILDAVFGDYSITAASKTFVQDDKGDTASNDVARLAGSRFVSVIETEQEKKLAEGFVKQATGGDVMSARFLFKEYFEFIPVFKIWMATNHKPRVRGTDNAIWRRIRLLPFLIIFADPEEAEAGQPIKDLGLKEKLMQELPGILRWVLDGVASWRVHGLTQAPAAVMEATKEYRESQDATEGFIVECCHVSPGLQSTVGDLFKAYKIWCISNGETAISSTAFGLALEEKGYPSARAPGGKRMRKGLMLKEEYSVVEG